jgi:hypothetical protein
MILRICNEVNDDLAIYPDPSGLILVLFCDPGGREI